MAVDMDINEEIRNLESEINGLIEQLDDEDVDIENDDFDASNDLDMEYKTEPVLSEDYITELKVDPLNVPINSKAYNEIIKKEPTNFFNDTYINDDSLKHEGKTILKSILKLNLSFFRSGLFGRLGRFKF